MKYETSVTNGGGDGDPGSAHSVYRARGGGGRQGRRQPIRGRGRTPSIALGRWTWNVCGIDQQAPRTSWSSFASARCSTRWGSDATIHCHRGGRHSWGFLFSAAAADRQGPACRPIRPRRAPAGAGPRMAVMPRPRSVSRSGDAVISNAELGRIFNAVSYTHLTLPTKRIV